MTQIYTLPEKWNYVTMDNLERFIRHLAFNDLCLTMEEIWTNIATDQHTSKQLTEFVLSLDLVSFRAIKNKGMVVSMNYRAVEVYQTFYEVDKDLRDQFESIFRRYSSI